MTSAYCTRESHNGGSSNERPLIEQRNRERHSHFPVCQIPADTRDALDLHEHVEALFAALALGGGVGCEGRGRGDVRVRLGAAGGDTHLGELDVEVVVHRAETAAQEDGGGEVEGVAWFENEYSVQA